MEKDPGRANDRTIWSDNRELVLKLMAEFNKTFPTEEHSQSWLYSHAEAGGFLKCQHCFGIDIKKITNRIIKCSSCGDKTWITAGTFFSRVRQIRPYLAAFQLLENGAVISASWFADLLDIAISSAAAILKKLGMVIQNDMDEATPVVSSVEFSALIVRRSRESLRSKHPRAELNEIERLCVERTPKKVASGEECPLNKALLSISDTDRVVYEALSENPTNFDLLCDHTSMSAAEVGAALSMLELSGLVVAVSGNRFRRAVPAVPAQAASARSHTSSGKETNNTIDNVIATIQQIHGGCSRKCLQIYMALFWCHSDRVRWGLGSLFKACFKHPSIEYADIVAYISPPFIKVMPQCEAI